MKNSKQIWWTVSGSALVGLGLGIYFLWVKNKKESTTKIQNRTKVSPQKREQVVISNTSVKQTDKGIKVAEPNWSDPFDANYTNDVKKWIGPKKIVELNPMTAKQYAQELYKAKGGAWFKNDNEKIVNSVFAKKLKDKVQVANLSLAFWKFYQKDMWEYLHSFLSVTEMEKYVGKPTRQLPKYRIATE